MGSRSAASKAFVPALRVLILTCMHPTDDGRVSYRYARSFTAAGHGVTWVGPDRQISGQRPNGIRWELYSPGHGRRGRLAHWARSFWRARSLGPFDVVYAPELDSTFAALLLRLTGGAGRVIFDVHEMYTGEMLARWSIPFVRKASRQVLLTGLRQLAKRSDLVIGVSEPVLQGLPIAAGKRLIVRNAPPRSFATAERPATSRNCTVMHGKATRHHGTAAVLEGYALTAKDFPATHLLLFDVFPNDRGTYPREEFDQAVAALGIADRIVLQPLVPYDGMGSITAACDVGLIAHGREWAIGSSPNRLYEYLAAGIPVVGPSYAPEIRKVIEDHQCGLVVDTEVPGEIAAALRVLFADPQTAAEMGRRGQAAFLSHLSWEAQFEPVKTWLRTR